MKHLILLAIVMTMLVAPTVHAAEARITGKVVRTMVVDGRWGGCMVELNTSISAQLPGCPIHKWITFSCSGTFNTKDIAYRKFDSAQMAKALNRRVMIWVTDAKKHNGFCYGFRIDVL